MRFFLLIACLSLCSEGLRADTYLLNDGGSEKEFEIDCTTFICRPAGGGSHVIEVGDKGTEAEIIAESVRLEADSSPQFDLRLYEKGKPREKRYERWLVRKIYAKLAPEAEAAAVAQAAGASSFETPQFAPGSVVLTFAQAGDSLKNLEAVRQLPGVVSADPLMARQKSKRLVPDDPEFSYSASNPQYQWHLNNTGQNGSLIGLDANVVEVWDTLRGSGVTIGVVDDGLEVAHPDLAPNVNTAIDHDWNDNTPNDPTPTSRFDDHGTSCAGVAAARGNNGIGVSGVAPEASLVGLRLIAGNTTDQEDGEAIAWRTDVIDVSSNSWGPIDADDELFAPGPLVSAAFVDGVTNGRDGKGVIYVWAAGNGRDDGDYSNYDGYNNRIETISVGAVAFNGKQSFYSESGANLLISAPSDDDDGDPGITTTTLTRNGSYTDEFGGTSSATPLVAGVVALILEQNPELGWRDVQEILVSSALKIDRFDPGWKDNAAGFHFNHRYGAGMVDAAAAVALADGWVNLPSQELQSAESGEINRSIPDNNANGLTYSFDMTGNPEIRVEHARLTVDIEHPYRGDLEITLTSPSGTVSQFTEERGDGNSNIDNYAFLSVRNWGEMSSGNWTVRVADLANEDQGRVSSLKLDLYGSSTDSGYNDWASTMIPAGEDASAEADVDGDGHANLIEYAFSTNPIAGGDPNPLRFDAGGGFEFDVDTSKTDLTFIVQMSTDLKSWQPVSTTLVSEDGGIEKRRVELSSLDGEKFYVRVSVTRG